MSVSKFTKSLNCSITFYPSSCVFQELKTGMKIGGGHEAGGLYYLDGGGRASIAFQSSLSPLQWHCRFGHPSLKVLKSLVPSKSTFCFGL